MFLKSPERALDALFAVDGTFTPNMLFEILRRGDRQKLILKSAANMQTETFKSMMLGHHHVDDMAKMYNALKAVKPDTVMNEDEFRDLAKEKTAEAVSSYYQEQDKIKAYIHGDIAFDEVYPIVKRTKLDYHVAATAIISSILVRMISSCAVSLFWGVVWEHATTNCLISQATEETKSQILRTECLVLV